MQFIERTKDGKLIRNKPPQDWVALFWVDVNESWALIDMVLYRDGQPCDPGEYELPVPENQLCVIRVTAKGEQAEVEVKEVTEDAGGGEN